MFFAEEGNTCTLENDVQNIHICVNYTFKTWKSNKLQACNVVCTWLYHFACSSFTCFVCAAGVRLMWTVWRFRLCAVLPLSWKQTVHAGQPLQWVNQRAALSSVQPPRPRAVPVLHSLTHLLTPSCVGWTSDPLRCEPKCILD